MSLKIFHTADLHIGLKFTRGYETDVRTRLLNARFDVLEKMIALANEQGCDLFVIAGDLFNQPRVSRKDILKVIKILRDFDGQVVILPGNHDYHQAESGELWHTFHDEMSENVLLLLEPKCYEMELGGLRVALYPGPCRSKHSKKNALGWLGKHKKSIEIEFHIGIAHGSLEGISPDFNQDYFPMTSEELFTTELDLWLMGHTHKRVPDTKKGSGGGIFFASTPEPDGFDCDHEGYAWLFEISGKEDIKYDAVEVGSFRFLTLEKELSNEEDFEALGLEFQNFPHDRNLVKLKAMGRISKNLFETRTSFWNKLSTHVLHLEVDDFDLLRKISEEDIKKEFTESSFPYELLMGLLKEDGSPLAVQIAYDLIQEVKS